MRKTRTIAVASAVAVAAATILVTSIAVFADESKTGPVKAFAGHFMKGFFNADPVERLEKQKENLRQRVADGKMTQEEADKVIAKLEEQVKQLQEFSSMTTEQKKEKLLKDFTASINDRVKEGKLTQEKADQMLDGFKAKLDTWDGSGNPPLIGKGFMGKAGEGFKGRAGARHEFKGMRGKADPSEMLEKQKENLRKRVADGKMTPEEADKVIARLEEKVKQTLQSSCSPRR